MSPPNDLPDFTTQTSESNIVANDVTIIGGQGSQTVVQTSLPQQTVTSFTPTVDGTEHVTSNFTVPAGTNQLLVCWNSALQPVTKINQFFIAGVTTGAKFYSGEIVDAQSTALGFDGFIVPFSQAYDAQAYLSYAFQAGAGTVYVIALLTPIAPQSVVVTTPDIEAPIYTTPVPMGYPGNISTAVQLSDVASTAGGVVLVAGTALQRIVVLGGHLVFRPSALTLTTYGAYVANVGSTIPIAAWSAFLDSATGLLGQVVPLNVPDGGIPLGLGDSLRLFTMSGDTAATVSGVIYYAKGVTYY